MIIDARTIPKGTKINTEVCIVGAGAAGITLAREFKGAPFKVCLLEAGGLEFEEATQSLYKGEIAGLPYHELEATRLRYFGGTTNHWGGATRPLDEIDFEERDWLPNSGWPFDREHLLPFYKRAQSVFQLGPFVYDGKDWETEEQPRAKFKGNTLTSHVIHQTGGTRFGQIYREEIKQAKNLDAYLHANVIEIETNHSARSATRVRVSSLEKNEFAISARIFIVATGGIENARLLLLSNRFNRRGLGNGYGLVGRYFMDHPNAWFGKPGIIIPTRFPLPFYGEHNETNIEYHGSSKKVITWGFITPTEKTLRHMKLLSCGFAIRPADPETDSAIGVKSMRNIKSSLGSGDWPDDFWRHLGNVVSDIDSIAFLAAKKLTGHEPTTALELMYWAEQAPNPASRVRLSHERDSFGQQRVALEWRFTERNEKDLKRMLQLLATELGQSGLGRLGVNPVMWSDNWISLFSGSSHHMGTTRMHMNPKKGVVDPDCRIHNVSNVYIAGSSVFPTSGHANPTLTIVALALRLADHIKQQMRQKS
jgi:choline dehydrogenase-like flavoprotein